MTSVFLNSWLQPCQMKEKKKRKKKDQKNLDEYQSQMNINIWFIIVEGSWAGTDEAFKTFTIQVGTPPSWSWKGICDSV